MGPLIKKSQRRKNWDQRPKKEEELHHYCLLNFFNMSCPSFSSHTSYSVDHYHYDFLKEIFFQKKWFICNSIWSILDIAIRTWIELLNFRILTTSLWQLSIFQEILNIDRLQVSLLAYSSNIQIMPTPKICIKYRKHGSSSFSHTFNCVCVSLFLISNDFFTQKLPFFVALYHVTFLCGP